MTSGKAFPEPIRHSLTLLGGRKLCYYTFRCKDEVGDPLPVLYVNGFPGSGLEGRLNANRVAREGGQIFAIDRPGLGHSDPLPENLSDDERVEACVQDMWALVRELGWKAFSVIGVSGGGAFVLAFLKSYLDLCASGESPPAKLKHVAHVAGVCGSAGTQGMMPENAKFYSLCSMQKQSWFARMQLRIMFIAMRLMATYIPAWILLRFSESNALPKVDQDFMADKNVGEAMVDTMRDALRQGSRSACLEITTLFRAKAGWESGLKNHYTVGEDDKYPAYFPSVAVFQGDLDVHVPPSHAAYVQNQLLCGAAKLVTYKDQGHTSLVMGKGEDFSRFAVSGSTKSD